VDVHLGMSNEEFTALIERRNALAARHEELCDVCNEDGDCLSVSRDRVWAELEEVESLIADAIRDEMANEL
jgi:hypothetical protein